MIKESYRILFLLFILLYSCEKEESPIESNKNQSSLSNQIHMGAFYEQQLYYSLESNTVVSQNEKTAWDLAFSSTENKFQIYLNSSKLMSAYNTHQQDFSMVTDTFGLTNHQNWDSPTGHPDSTAIGNWLEFKPIYIINKGFNHIGEHLGYFKIQFDKTDTGNYLIKFGNISDLNYTILVIEKNADYNYQYFSFNDKNTVIIEPPKNEWDLIFTQYTHLFQEESITPYLVVGCLQNPHLTKAQKIIASNLDAISKDDVNELFFSTFANTIGYNWKRFTGNSYEIDTESSYLILNQNNYLFKLKFTDYYNNRGDKGYPTWIYSRMQP